MFFSYEEEINYAHEGCDIDDSMDLLIESYVNDYTIFEAVLRRDFMEATGVLTEAGNDNFLTKMWDKIVEFIDTIKAKIMGLIDKFCAKIDEIKKNKCKKIVDEYKKYFDKEYGRLSEYTISNFRLDPYVISTKGEIKENGFDLVKKAIPEMAKDIPYVNEISKDKLEALESAYDGFSLDDIKEDYNKMVWKDDDVENPFREASVSALISGLQTIITSKTSEIRNIKNDRKEFNRKVDKYKKDAKKKISETRKDKYIKSEKKEEDISKAQLYLKILSSFKKAMGSVFSFMLKETGKIFKESVRLYKSAGNYLKRKIEEDKDKKPTGTADANVNPEVVKAFHQSAPVATYFDKEYNTAIGEAAVYELGLGDL